MQEYQRTPAVADGLPWQPGQSRDAEDATRRPRPSSFRDYRSYLRMMVRHLKHTTPTFTFRSFSGRAGFSSPAVLKNVVEGRRNISIAAIVKVGRGLDLNADEIREFDALVRYSLAENEEVRALQLERLKAGAAADPIEVLAREQYTIYDRWYLLPLLEVIGLPDFREDHAWIAAKFRRSVTPAQISSAITFLLESHLVERSQSGHLRRVNTKVTTPARLNVLSVRRYNREVAEMGLEALDSLPPRLRHLSSCSVRLSRTQYEMVEKLLEEFRHRLLHLVEDTPSSSAGPQEQQEVHNLGFALYPVTVPVDASGGNR